MQNKARPALSDKSSPCIRCHYDLECIRINIKMTPSRCQKAKRTKRAERDKLPLRTAKCFAGSPFQTTDSQIN